MSPLLSNAILLTLFLFSLAMVLTLIRLFNMPQSDQKKFDSFLKKYDCQLSS